MSQQWGTVTAFLINSAGETIYHPLLKPNNKLVDDPIFIPVSQLEQDKAGEPVEFLKVLFLSFSEMEENDVLKEKL